MFLSGSKWSALQPERAAAADMLGGQREDLFGAVRKHDGLRIGPVVPCAAACMRFVLCAGVNL